MRCTSIARSVRVLAQAGVGIGESAIFVIADGSTVDEIAKITEQRREVIPKTLHRLSQKELVVYDRAAKCYRHTPKGRNLMTKL